MSLGPDAGQHQQLRRIQRSRAQDHFLSRTNLITTTIPHHFHSVSFTSFRIDQYFRNSRFFSHVQITTMSYWSEECFRSAASRASVRVFLHKRAAQRVFPVRIAKIITRFAARFKKRRNYRRSPFRLLYLQISSARMIFGVEKLRNSRIFRF